MEHAIAITRSQLQQVIEDYIAASRVGDTLSYVETAKLSAAEAAESSTSRIWQGLCVVDPVPATAFEISSQLLSAAAVEEVALAAESLQQATLAEFTCAEDLAAGQIVIVNSRGMIEGKRDEADQTMRAEARIELSYPIVDQLHSLFSSDEGRTITLIADKSGRLWAETDPKVGAVPLGEHPDLLPPGPESQDDFF